jgi:hypothetical protein
MSIEIPTKEDFLELKKQTERLQVMLEHLLINTVAPQTVTAEEIARIEGVSKSHIYDAGRYLLPRFGESAFPGGRKRWTFQEFLSWRDVDPRDREAQYKAYLEDERKRTVVR